LTNATKQVRAASDFGRAALHAQSLLDQAGVGEALAVGRRDGEIDDGRYRWEINVTPFRDPATPRQPQILGAPQLLQLELTMRWGKGGPRETLRVQSLRLMTPTDINAIGATP
jgi:general secretion pathway protein I